MALIRALFMFIVLWVFAAALLRTAYYLGYFAFWVCRQLFKAVRWAFLSATKGIAWCYGVISKGIKAQNNPRYVHAEVIG